MFNVCSVHSSKQFIWGHINLARILLSAAVLFAVDLGFSAVEQMTWQGVITGGSQGTDYVVICLERCSCNQSSLEQGIG